MRFSRSQSGQATVEFWNPEGTLAARAEPQNGGMLIAQGLQVDGEVNDKTTSIALPMPQPYPPLSLTAVVSYPYTNRVATLITRQNLGLARRSTIAIAKGHAAVRRGRRASHAWRSRHGVGRTG